MKNSIFIFFSVLTVFTLLSSKCPPPVPDDDLRGLIEHYGFIPFEYANSAYAPLTIMLFNKKSDNEIIANPKDCIKDLDYEDNDQAVALINRSFTQKKSNDISLVIPKELLQLAQIETAIKDSIFESVTITIDGAFVNYVSKIKAQRLFKEAPLDCKNEVMSDDNIIIHKVVGCKEITYKFQGFKNKEVDFSADVFDKVRAKDAYWKELQDNGVLTYKGRIFLGFTAFKGRLESGMIETSEVELIELNKDDVEGIKSSVLQGQI